jgi:twitching motility protein PilT
MHNPELGSRMGVLLAAVWQAGGTDLLLTPGAPPLIRVGGALRPAPGRDRLTAEDTTALLAELLTPEQAARHSAAGQFDFAFTWRDRARVRGNAFRQRGETAIALRMIPRDIPDLDALMLPPVVRGFAALHQGLVLVTGAAGAGKSTTLASLINEINATRACHILTIEDPIEYLHEHQRSAVNQREVGTDTESFPLALGAALREHPDVLLVGELRDPDSIRAALTVAETGHLVLAGLHTNDLAQSVARIVDVFPPDQQPQIRVQLATVLAGIVHQRLIPRTSGGLVAAQEVLVANPAVRSLIKDGRPHELRNTLITGQRDGMITLEQSLATLVRTGLITLAEATVRSRYPMEIEAQLRPRPAAAA